MTERGAFKRLSLDGRERFAIYDTKTGRPYVLVVYPDMKKALDELVDLLKPYPDGHEWRERLAVKSASGCGSRGPKGKKCNLAEGHSGEHEEVYYVSMTRKRSMRWQ